MAVARRPKNKVKYANQKVKAQAPDDKDNRRCRYPSKVCLNNRVEKRNGELHNFCEYHRQKANANQRRMESRRKEGQHLKPKTPSSRRSKRVAKQQSTKLRRSNSLDGYLDDMTIETPTETPRSLPLSYSWTDADSSLVVDAAGDFMLPDTSIETEPFDSPIGLYEEDLFFLDSFLDEMYPVQV